MKREILQRMEAYMVSCMGDSAHDREHVYRVLGLALTIAETEPAADRDLLTAACLLHDIGRAEQLADPRLDHALVGAEKAEAWLLREGFSPAFSAASAACIRSHRFRRARPPESIEAKILFDADKLDVCGAIGIARTLQYGGRLGCPLYFREGGAVADGAEGHSGRGDERDISFFQEYHFKLEKLSDRFYTAEGARLARERKAAAENYYENLLREVRASDAALAALFPGFGGA